MLSIMFTVLGAIGSFFLAVSGLPQAIKSYIDGHSKGMAGFTVLLWLWGEMLMLLYSMYFYGNDIVLVLNYFMNFLLVAIIFKYKYYPRKGIK
jgi:hypothetical protein